MTGDIVSRVAKRTFDLCASLLGLAILTPVLLTISVLVFYRLGRPVLFRQLRSGARRQSFKLVKFRTMTDARNSHGALLDDSLRMTELGAFLRRTSLDELPELWNVLKGEMSIVGPRPLLPEYLSRYTARQARRHQVRPGITGWAQVNGRNTLSWEQRFELDVWYVENWSLILDLRILGLTLLHLLRQDGISHPGAATMHPFTGGRKE